MYYLINGHVYLVLVLYAYIMLVLCYKRYNYVINKSKSKRRYLNPLLHTPPYYAMRLFHEGIIEHLSLSYFLLLYIFAYISVWFIGYGMKAMVKNLVVKEPKHYNKKIRYDQIILFMSNE
jgi:hypothetical protein